MNDKEFLNWVAGRLVNVYKESENVDFVIKLRKIAEALRPAKPGIVIPFDWEGRPWAAYVKIAYCPASISKTNDRCGDVIMTIDRPQPRKLSLHEMARELVEKGNWTWEALAIAALNQEDLEQYCRSAGIPTERSE